MKLKLQIRTFLIVVSLLFSGVLYSQKIETIDIDKYYKGGREQFLKFVATNVSYSETARENSIIGLSVFSFKIDCENSPYDFKFDTRLGYGIEKSLQKTIIRTKRKWLACDEISAGRRVNMKIVFSLNGDYGYKDADFFVIADSMNKVLSNNDLTIKVNEAIPKHKYSQAKEYLDLLLLRFPYNEAYINKLKYVNSKIDSLNTTLQQK